MTYRNNDRSKSKYGPCKRLVASLTDGIVVHSCSIGMYGGSPSPADCLACPKYVGPSRGAGDLIAKVTKSVGIKPCGKCQKRRERLNKMLPKKQKGDINGEG